MSESANPGIIDDPSLLLPLVRPRIDFEIVKLRHELSAQDGTGPAPVVYKVVANELAVTLVIDHDENWQALSPTDLQSLKLNLGSALSIAKQNLVENHQAFDTVELFTRHDDQSWSCLESDDYESSLVFLFPELVEQLPVSGKALIFAPTANSVWLADSTNTRAVTVLANASLAAYENATESRLTPIPFVLNGKRWLPYRVQPKHPAHQPIHAAWLLHEHEIYAAQREVLEGNATDDSPLAAKVAIGPSTTSTANQPPYSFACLLPGIQTLLPKTEYVLLQRGPQTADGGPGPDKGSQAKKADHSVSNSPKVVIVPWNALLDTLGGKIEKQAYYPERYLLSASPTESEWQQLLQHHVEIDCQPDDDRNSQSATPVAQQAEGTAAAPKLTTASENVVDQALAELGESATVASPSLPQRQPIAPKPQTAPTASSYSNGLVFWLAALAVAAIVIGLALIGLTIAFYFIFADDSKPSRLSRTERSANNRVLPSQLPSRSRTGPLNSSESTFPPPAAPTLDPSSVTFPRIEFDETLAIESKHDSFTGSETFACRAPVGGILVGLHVGIGDGWGGSIHGIRPIFQVGNEYKHGKWCGAGELTDVVALKAREGYAVGAIHVHSSLVIDSIQLEYFGVTEDGTLDVTQTYSSPRVGGEGGSLHSLKTQLGFAVELSGTYSEQLVSLGWKTLAPLPTCDSMLGTVSWQRSQPLDGFGDTTGEFHEDIAPAESVLVGLRVTTGDSWGGVIASLQPIYQKEDQYLLGDVLGETGHSVTDLVARPGYVVAGVNVKQGLVLNCVQLVFNRLEEGRLIESDDYRSAWIGIDSGSLGVVSSETQPIVGVQLWSDGDIEGINLFGGQD